MTSEIIDVEHIQVVEVGIPGAQGAVGLLEVDDDGNTVVVPVGRLDFSGGGFAVSQQPGQTARVELDLSEVAAAGELAGFLDAPTVDVLHSGSTHQSVLDQINAHEIDVVDAHDAAAVSFVPTGTITSADAQSAIVEALSDANAYTDDGHVILSVRRSAVDGVAALDGTGKVPSAQLPAFSVGSVFTVASQAEMLALAAAKGDIAVRTDTSQTFILSALPASTLGNWVELLFSGSGAVSSVNTRTGAVTGLEETSNKGALSGYAALDGSGYVPDAQLNPAIARDSEVSGAVTTHEAAADPHTGYQKETEKAAASGYASLDAGIKVPIAQLARPKVTLTDGASIATDASAGSLFQIAGNRAARTIANPTAGVAGQQITYTLENTTSNTALSTVTTWGSAFKLAGAWTDPDPEFARSISFVHDGTVWIETARTGANLQLGWLPTDLSGLVGWWDATSMIGDGDGAVVTTWASRSGSNFVALSGHEPTLKLNIQNGRPVVRFDGTDDYLRVANPLTGTQSASVFVTLAKTDTDGALGYRTLLDFANTGNNGLIVHATADNSSAEPDDEMFWQFGTGAAVRKALPTGMGTAWHQWSWIVPNGSPAALYRDAGANIPPSVAGNVGYSAISQAYTYLGSNQGTRRYLYADVGEVLVFNVALSDVNRALVAAYLKTKWGTP